MSGVRRCIATTDRLHIAIVGGGVAGLTAALALGARGHRVALFERAPEFAEVGAGLQLSCNAMRALGALGLGSALEQVGVAPEAVQLRDGRSGQALARLRLGAVIRARHDAPHLLLHRADLIEVLRAAAAPVARLNSGIEVAGGQPEHGLLRLADGREIQVDLVIGADGLRSMSRAADPVPTGMTAWRALLPWDGPADSAALTEAFLCPGAHLVSYPLRHGTARRRNLVAITEDQLARPESWEARSDPAPLRAAFAQAAPEVQALLAPLEEVRPWGLYRHHVPQFTKGKLALIGDAAHPTVPFLAQGAGMAVEDALILADCLDARPVPEALALYQALRRPRTHKIVRESTRAGRIYHLSGPMAQARNMALRAAPRLWFERRMDWLYGYDPVRAVQSA